jgi:hypothetical protein
MRHVWSDEDIADPALVWSVCLIAAERPSVAQQLGSREAPSAELLAKRPLGDPDAVARCHDLADVGGTAGRLLQTQSNGLIEQRGVGPGATPVRPRPVVKAS